jgi:hypothetical protein
VANGQCVTSFGSLMMVDVFILERMVLSLPMFPHNSGQDPSLDQSCATLLFAASCLFEGAFKRRAPTGRNAIPTSLGNQ